MKHLHFIFLILPLFIFCACGKTETVSDEIFLEEDILTENEEYIVVGFSQVGSESDWRLANTESYKSVFTEENGYYLLFDHAQQKQENQLKAIRNFILQKVDYIVLDPIVETGWDAVLQEAKDAGIPVILADRTAEVQDESLYTCWVGSDFQQEGRAAAYWLADYLEKCGRQDETIHIVTLQGTLNSSSQLGRTEGFEQVLKEHENWVMLERCSGDFTQAKGKEVMEAFLEKYEKIDVVISENDNMTFGAIDAMKRAGKTYGKDGEIIIISFDAMKAALEAMAAGEINADFECNPSTGNLVDEVIQRLERGETVEKIQYIEEQYFDTSMDLEKILEQRSY